MVKTKKTKTKSTPKQVNKFACGGKIKRGKK